MKQTIRNQIFETNSSSVHSIVLFNDNKVVDIKTIKYKVPIRDDLTDKGYLTSIEDKLAYLYSLALYNNDWELLDLLKSHFNNCIFEKPVWKVKVYNEEDGAYYKYLYCDDKEIISFAECAQIEESGFAAYFDENDLIEIKNNLIDIIFSGEIYIARDGSYENDIIPKYKLEIVDAGLNDINNWIKDNIKLIIKD